MRLNLIFACLVFALPMLAQDTTAVSARLVDKSAANSPFSFRGTVKCSEWVEGEELRSKADGSIDVLNISQRQIVAWAAKSSVSCLHGGIEAVTVRDHFFQDHSIPEDSWEIPASFNEGTKDSYEDGVKKDPRDILHSASNDPQLTVELTFVQFEDGSIWGSQEVFSQIQAKREAQQELLQQLQNVQDKTGAGSVIEKMSAALNAANARKASGKF